MYLHPKSGPKLAYMNIVLYKDTGRLVSTLAIKRTCDPKPDDGNNGNVDPVKPDTGDNNGDVDPVKT